jgi:heme-degrading monooxygenase HmoA
MWIRLGSFAVVPGRAEELRATYNLDCAPIVRAVAGNLDCYLMENAEERDRCIVCTVWESEADAVAYEASGTAQAIVARVRGFFAGPPTLASYRVERGR